MCIIVIGSVENAFQTMNFLKKNEVDISFLDINLTDNSGINLYKKLTSTF